MSNNKAVKVIMHNSISLDGAFIGLDFPPELMGLHYQIAAEFGACVRLFGSSTGTASIELFGGFTPETPEDLIKPHKGSDLSYWVVPDSRAVLMGRLHYFRRSEYCRDVAVLIAEDTPADYVKYLKARDYDYFIAGSGRVDLSKALTMIAEHYQINTVMVDSGRSLTNAMLDRGLVDEISLLVLPTIVGKNAATLFSDLNCPVELSLISTRTYPGGYTHFRFETKKPTRPQAAPDTAMSGVQAP